MNAVSPKSFDVDAYRKKVAAVRDRLMNPAVKASAPAVSVRSANPRKKQEWRAGETKFDAHVKAYRASSVFAFGPNIYVRRRSVEMGFSPEDAQIKARYRPIVALRIMLVAEIKERFNVSLKQIADILGCDDSNIYNHRRSSPPTPAEVSVCEITPVGLTFFEAIERDYRRGVKMDDIAVKYRLSHTTVPKLADRNGWPRRGNNSKGAKQ